MISAVGDGWDIWTWLLLWPTTISVAFGWIASAVILGLTVFGTLMYKRNRKAWDVLAGAPVEAEAAPAMD